MPQILKRKESLILISILIIVFGGLFYYFGPFSARASGDLIKISPNSLIAPPATIDGRELPEAGWQNPEAAFSQDLPETAASIEFNIVNSAYPLEIPQFSIEETATPPQEGIVFSEERSLELSNFSVSDNFEGTKINNVQLRLSLAGRGRAGDKLTIDYYYQDFYPEGSQGDSFRAWQSLANFDLENEISNNLNGGYFLYALPIFESWEDLNNLKIRFTYQNSQYPISNIQYPTSNIQYPVYLDAVWLEVEYEDVKKEVMPPEVTSKKNFRLDEEPEFVISQKDKKSKLKIRQVNLILPNNKEQPANFSFKEMGGDYRLKLNPKDFVWQNPGGRPGRYFLKLEVEKAGKIYYLEQEFFWGVLAININKSIYPVRNSISNGVYLPNETAYLQMAVLDDSGHTICDANLKLEIIPPVPPTSPTGFVTSPVDGVVFPEIQKSGECGPNNVTDVPDYFAYYELPKATQRETDAKQGRETDAKQIIWQVDWKEGEIYEISYQFDTPDISPYLYLLGPLEFYE